METRRCKKRYERGKYHLYIKSLLVEKSFRNYPRGRRKKNDL